LSFIVEVKKQNKIALYHINFKNSILKNVANVIMIFEKQKKLIVFKILTTFAKN